MESELSACCSGCNHLRVFTGKVLECAYAKKNNKPDPSLMWDVSFRDVFVTECPYIEDRYARARKRHQEALKRITEKPRPKQKKPKIRRPNAPRTFTLRSAWSEDTSNGTNGTVTTNTR